MNRLHVAFSKSAVLLLIINTALMTSPLANAQEAETATPPPAAGETVKCPQYKVYYIDPATQFFTPPVPIEDHAEFVFCSDHKKLDELRARLKTMKPIRSHADIDTARIKVVPKGRPDDAITFCSTGELTFRGKQYRVDRRFFEPALVSIQTEGDKRRSMAIEQETEDERLVDKQAQQKKAQGSREPAKAP